MQHNPAKTMPKTGTLAAKTGHYNFLTEKGRYMTKCCHRPKGKDGWAGIKGLMYGWKTRNIS